MKRIHIQYIPALAFLIVAFVFSGGLSSARAQDQSDPLTTMPPGVINSGSSVNVVSQASSPPAPPSGSSGGSNLTSSGGSNLTSSGGSNTQPTQTATLQNPLCSGTGSSCTGSSIGSLVSNFAAIFSYIVVLLAVLLLIWTGLEFILAQGNSAKLTDLKRRLLYIVIGVAVVIGARIIITVVINTLSATGAVNSNVIQSAKSANGGQ